MAFRSSSPVPTAGPGHSFSVMTVLSEVNLAVCDSLFSLFSQSSVLYLASDIRKIAPAFAEFTLRPKSSALTTPERNVFSPFPGKGTGFSPFCSFPVQNHIWAQRGGSAPEVLSGKQQTKPCLQLPLWLIQLCRYSCFQSTRMNFCQSLELKPLSIISPIGQPFQNESIIRL